MTINTLQGTAFLHPQTIQELLSKVKKGVYIWLHSGFREVSSAGKKYTSLGGFRTPTSEVLQDVYSMRTLVVVNHSQKYLAENLIGALVKGYGNVTGLSLYRNYAEGSVSDESLKYLLEEVEICKHLRHLKTLRPEWFDQPFTFAPHNNQFRDFDQSTHIGLRKIKDSRLPEDIKANVMKNYACVAACRNLEEMKELFDLPVHYGTDPRGRGIHFILLTKTEEQYVVCKWDGAPFALEKQEENVFVDEFDKMLTEDEKQYYAHEYTIATL